MSFILYKNGPFSFIIFLAYQVNVDFWMAQSSTTSITGHNSGLNISHWLLCHQVDGKVLVQLYTKKKSLILHYQLRLT